LFISQTPALIAGGCFCLAIFLMPMLPRRGRRRVKKSKLKYKNYRTQKKP
jgi:hypothetical protein